jgi:TetR/AcrR family transcriptional repressor NalC
VSHPSTCIQYIDVIRKPQKARDGGNYGPARTASFIRSVLESHRNELRKTSVPLERIAVILHDSLTGDVLYQLLAGVGKHESDAELERLACAAVDVILGNICSDAS